MLLDKISDEYSVFYLNHSDFPVATSTNFYKEFENNLLKISDNVIKSQMPKINKFNFLRQLQDNDFFNLKIINRTKKLFRENLIENIKSQIEADLLILFDDYLTRNNKPTEKELDFYCLNYDCTQEKQSKNIKKNRKIEK